MSHRPVDFPGWNVEQNEKGYSPSRSCVGDESKPAKPAFVVPVGRKPQRMGQHQLWWRK